MANIKSDTATAVYVSKLLHANGVPTTNARVRRDGTKVTGGGSPYTATVTVDMIYPSQRAAAATAVLAVLRYLSGYEITETVTDPEGSHGFHKFRVAGPQTQERRAARPEPHWETYFTSARRARLYLHAHPGADIVVMRGNGRQPTTVSHTDTTTRQLIDKGLLTHDPATGLCAITRDGEVARVFLELDIND